MRKIHLSNEARRDAEVAFGSSSRRTRVDYVTGDGRSALSERRVKATQQTDTPALQERYGEGLAQALIDGDPEIDMERDGLKVEGLRKVYLTGDGSVAYGVTLSEHVYGPDGSEKAVRPVQATAGNISDDAAPIRWTGKLIPKKQAMRKFVFRRSYQVQHVNGLTYDFLYAMAKELADKNAMMLVGAGPKGIAPLVMTNGGTPYRAFLEGRVEGNRYALILRLTNLELKSIIQQQA